MKWLGCIPVIKYKTVIHTLRVSLSFSLLGAILVGCFFSWNGMSQELRLSGAIAGFMFGLIAELNGFFDDIKT